MKRWFALPSILLVFALSALAGARFQYDRYQLHELCLEADVVVVGRIVDLDQHTFEVSISRRIAGGEVPERVRMQRFVNWTCAARFAPYKRDQELLLFLRRSRDGQSLRPIGAGCEGEMPVLGEDVGLHNFSVHDVPLERVLFGNREIRLQRVPLEEFVAAIRHMREWLEFTKSTTNRSGSIVPRGQSDGLEMFAKTSKIAWHLADGLFSSPEWGGAVPDEGPRLQDHAQAHIVMPQPEASSIRHLAWLGDLDGDGTHEALASLDDPGALAIVRLPHVGPARIEALELDARPVVFGPDVSTSLGDLDGDGSVEVALDAGESGLSLLSIARDGKSARWRELPGGELLAQAGLMRSDPVGLTTLGDLDADGTLEFVVSSYESSFDAGGSRNSISVLSIDRNSTLVRARRCESPTFAPLRWPWISVAALGDVDGDGVVDVAVGDRSDGDDRLSRGAVWVVFLERDGSVRSATKSCATSAGFRWRFVEDERFAEALAAPGDIDGDSIPDLLASSSTGVWLLRLTRDGSVRSVSRLRNPRAAGIEPTTSGRSAKPMFAFGEFLVCGDSTVGDRKIVLAGAHQTASRRTGLLSLSFAPDGNLRLR